MTLPVHDREQAIRLVLNEIARGEAFEHTPFSITAERIVDALLGQSNHQGGDAHERNATHKSQPGTSEALSSDVARAGDAEDRVPGQPDQEVERLREQVANATEALNWAKAPTTDDALAGVERRAGMPPQGYTLAGRIRALYSRERIEANRQRGRAERLRAVEQGARHVVDTKAFYVSTLGRSGVQSLALLLSAIDGLKEDLDRSSSAIDQHRIGTR